MEIIRMVTQEQQDKQHQKKHQQRVGDIIQRKEIESWNAGDTILILSPTGSGKSFFVNHYLKSYCEYHNKTILWISNRIALKRQNQRLILEDSNKDSNNVITTINYQEIETRLLRDEIIAKFDYIVADECHYFFTDSKFNNRTDVSLEWLLKRKGCIKILCSATGTLLKHYLQYRNIDAITYEIAPDYSYIDDILFYNDKDLINIIANIPKDEKIMYFASAENALNVHKEFPDSAFLCSSYNSFYKHSNKEAMQQINKNEKFDCRLLCTTTVLDNGININDSSVKHIIVDYHDLDIIQQCIGRKRIEYQDDRLTVYIRNRSKQSLNGSLHYNTRILEPVYYFNKHSQAEYVNKYPKTDSALIYKENDKDDNTILRLNNIMWEKYRYENMTIKEMMKEKIGFAKAVLQRFNREEEEIEILESESDMSKLVRHLDDMVNIKMFKEEQEEFKDNLLNNLWCAPKLNHGCLGLKTINSLFDDYGLKYTIKNMKETKGENRNKRYWIIQKL
jgi:hypothetical protein